MSASLTTNILIESVKRRASIPDFQDLLDDSDFLAFANEELLCGVVPLVLSMQEEFFVWSEEVSITANTSNYTIPYRAIGGKLRDIFYKDTQGNLREMTRISSDDKSYFQNSNEQNRFQAFYLQNNDVVLVPSVGASPVGSLVFSYYLRPNEIVAETRAGAVVSVSSDATTTTYTLNRFPASMAITNVVDIIQGRPGHKTRKFDLVPTAMDSAAKTITFTTTDLPSGVVSGDYINYAGECIVPQIPPELHSMLAQRVAARCVEAMGDTAGLQAANLKLAEMEAKTPSLIDNRTEGAPQKITNRNSLLRASKIKRGW